MRSRQARLNTFTACLERHVKPIQGQPGGLGAASLLAAAGGTWTRMASLLNGYAATVADLLSRGGAVAADAVGVDAAAPACFRVARCQNYPAGRHTRSSGVADCKFHAKTRERQGVRFESGAPARQWAGFCP